MNFLERLFCFLFPDLVEYDLDLDRRMNETVLSMEDELH